MSDKNTRRATVKASEYENRMDRLDQSASKPPVAAWCGEAARRISQAMLDPDTDAMKLFTTLLGGAHRSSSANRAGNRACSTACA